LTPQYLTELDSFLYHRQYLTELDSFLYHRQYLTELDSFLYHRQYLTELDSFLYHRQYLTELDYIRNTTGVLLLTISEYLGWPPVFGGICITHLFGFLVFFFVCLRLVSHVHTVTDVSELSILDCLFRLSITFIWL
jgi:hypothetical protein